MPLRRNLGLTKKMGLPNYGSAGASCAVELEVDSGLLQNNLEAFHEHVRSAYEACRGAVEEELARHRPSGPAAGSNGTAASSDPAVASDAASDGDGNRDNGHENGHNGQSQGASQRQLGYLRQLAGQIKGLGLRRLDGVAWRVFGKPVAAISAFEASSLIDTLKGVKAGQIELETVLDGEAS